MPDVAIVGAGELGGAIAHRLARRDLVGSIVLIDDNGSIAAGKALDILQAAPIERFATRISGTADLAQATAASIVVIAERDGSGGGGGDEGLLLKQLSAATRPPIVLCAAASHRELVERGVRELRTPRGRLLGTAPEALASAVRAMVALEANVSPNEVALTVLGVPPTHIVVPWEEATVAGLAIGRALDTPALRRVEARIARLWPPRAYALAAAAVNAIEMISGRSTRAASCFVGPDDSAGRRMKAAALPVRLGREGIVRVEMPELNAHDRVALENGILL